MSYDAVITNSGVKTMPKSKYIIEQEQNEKEVERLQKRIDELKAKNKQIAEYKKDKMKAVENDLINTFKRDFEKEGYRKAIINLNLKVTRDEILQNVPENSLEIEWIDNNYERILKKVAKIYENDEKAKQQIMQTQLAQVLKEQAEKKAIEEAKSKKEEEKANLFFNIANIIAFIFNPITIIILFFIIGYFAFALPVLNG